MPGHHLNDTLTQGISRVAANYKILFTKISVTLKDDKDTMNRSQTFQLLTQPIMYVKYT